MLVDYTKFLFENYNSDDFYEKALDRLMYELPDEFKDRSFAERLLKLMRKEDIILPNNIKVNLMLHVVAQNDERIRLTPCEVKIIERLAKANGKPISSEQLISEVWGYAEDNTILKVNICNIRKKLDIPIICIKGKGYLIESI